MHEHDLTFNNPQDLIHDITKTAKIKLTGLQSKYTIQIIKQHYFCFQHLLFAFDKE